MVCKRIANERVSTGRNQASRENERKLSFEIWHPYQCGRRGRRWIVNHRLGLGAYEVFRRNQLPHHFVWRMLGEGTYAVGIEPSTNRTAGRLDARARGELIQLEAGESRSYELELGALVGEDEISAFSARVDAVT